MIERIETWFYTRPFWCRIEGHTWQWEQPGSRAFCHCGKRADA